jgi:hypothetical protein
MQIQVANTKTEQSILRPLRLLAELIKEDLRHGDEAAEKAGMPYYQAAGEKMLEAKGQLLHGEFVEWCTRNFARGKTQCALYMSYASATIGIQKSAETEVSSLKEFARRNGDNRPTGGYVRRDWTAPVDDIVSRIDRDTLNIRRAEMNRAEERKAQQALGLRLIDIGYKVLAKELHPDKGGSRDAMARLNQVRDRLKLHA